MIKKLYKMTYTSSRGTVTTHDVSMMGLELTQQEAQGRIDSLNVFKPMGVWALIA